MTSRITVLGSNSFSGAHFVDHCLNEGMEVQGISRSGQPHHVFLPYMQNRNKEKFRFHQLDFNENSQKILSAIRQFKPAYVVNFAAQGMVGQSWGSPEDWFMTNTVSPLKLYEGLRELELQKFVQISTPEVYGSCEGTVKESTRYSPSTPYAVSKAAADMNLMAFKNAYEFPVAFTRAANVYGPCQQLYRIIPITILNILSGKKLQLHGGGHSVRSFIHIRDVAEGTLKVAREGRVGEIYHLSTTRMISIRQLVELICEMMDANFESCVEVVGDRLGKDSAYLLDTEKARTELDWSDVVSLEAGVQETIKWCSDNLDVLKKLPWSYIHKR
jgi:dTDP-glucose 4,6-dehydratase